MYFEMQFYSNQMMMSFALLKVPGDRSEPSDIFCTRDLHSDPSSQHTSACDLTWSTFHGVAEMKTLNL